jgi:hypothetical protein
MTIRRENGMTIEGDYMIIYGDANIILGNNNKIYGNMNTVQGDNNIIYGNMNTIYGNNEYDGTNNIINGNSKYIGIRKPIYVDILSEDVVMNNYFETDKQTCYTYNEISPVIYNSTYRVKTINFYQDGQLIKTINKNLQIV